LKEGELNLAFLILPVSLVDLFRPCETDTQ